jgi:hypothetical protein
MRTDNMAEMGDAWNRMRSSAIVLVAAAVVMALSASGAMAFGVSSRSVLGIVLGEAVLLIAVGGVRVFLAVAIGPLRRRRAFEPDRVREAPRPSLTWLYWLAAGGAAFLVASWIRGWLDFLDGSKHPAPSVGAYVLWVFVALIGFAAVTIAYVRDKDGALKASGRAGAWVARLGAAGSRNFERFIVAPVSEIAIRVGDRWIPAGDAGLGSAIETTGRFAVAGARLPVLPVIVALAVVLTLVVGLAAPGVFK